MSTSTIFKNHIENTNKKTIFIIIFSILFIILFILIKTNQIESFDISIYNLFAANINENFTSFFRFMTFLGEGVSIASFCVLALIISLILKKRDVGLVIAGCVAFNSIFSEVLKRIIQRPRPEILRLVSESSYSFPSSHTLASVSLCGILIYLIIRSDLNKIMKVILSIILVLFPLLIGISRIYLGVHNASDVLGGAMIAIILLLIEISIIEKKELF